MKDDILSSLKEVDLPQYKSCLEGKMTLWSFNAKGTRTEKPLELVHIDVCGVGKNPIWERFSYTAEN